MIKVGILSDTHGYFDTRLLKFFEDVDEVWHAGDIGNFEVARDFEALKPFRAVYGNIDGTEIRQVYPEIQFFQLEEVKVFIKHIGGYPGKYEKSVTTQLQTLKPNLFITGHSHILKVIFDKKYNLLLINPGAAGKYGMHQLQTAVRLVIDNGVFKDLEILELKR